MKKSIVFLFLLLISFAGYSESISDSIYNARMKVTDSLVRAGKGEYFKNRYGAKEYRDFGIGKKNYEIAKKNADTTIQLAKDCGNIVKKTYKEYGLKNTIRIFGKVTLPFAIFFILFMLFLSGRKKT